MNKLSDAILAIIPTDIETSYQLLPKTYNNSSEQIYFLYIH
jgi:hypothetical protein